MWRQNGSLERVQHQGCDSGLWRSDLAIRRPRKNGGAWRICSRLSGIKFRPLWDRNRLQYDHGDLSLETYWAKLAEDAGTRLEPEQLRNLSQWDVEMWAHINPTMVEWVKQMQSSGVKTGLLSNMPVDMIRYARQQFRLAEFV